MKISELRDAYYEASGKVSDLTRQLALAGIAVIWIFRVGTDSGGIKYSDGLLWPLAFFVASLAFDLLQYLYSSLLWGILNQVYWGRHHDNEFEVAVSGKWNWITIAFFWTKAVLMVCGYASLLRFIITQIQPAA